MKSILTERNFWQRQERILWIMQLCMDFLKCLTTTGDPNENRWRPHVGTRPTGWEPLRYGIISWQSFLSILNSDAFASLKIIIETSFEAYTFSEDSCASPFQLSSLYAWRRIGCLCIVGGRTCIIARFYPHNFWKKSSKMTQDIQKVTMIDEKIISDSPRAAVPNLWVATQGGVAIDYIAVATAWSSDIFF